MINTLHPEWVGKTLAFLNFELPAYEFATYTTTYSAPEMFSLLRDFTTRLSLRAPNRRAASRMAC